MGRISGKPGRPSNASIVASRVKPFLWTDQKIEAANLLGQADMLDSQVAEKSGIVLRTLYRWKESPAFMDRVRSAMVEAEERATTGGYGRKGRRIASLSGHVDLLARIVKERGEGYAVTHPDVPGAATGLLVLEETTIKTTTRNNHTNRTVTTEELVSRKWAVDAALVREHRGLLMQISKEVGGIVDRQMNLNVTVDAPTDAPADLGTLAGTLLGRLVPSDDSEGTTRALEDAVPE